MVEIQPPMPTVGLPNISIEPPDRCQNSSARPRAYTKIGIRSNDLSSRYEHLITFLRQKNPQLISRWRSVKPADIRLCSVVIYELRFGAERSSDPLSEHMKLDFFVAPFLSLPFDDESARKCGFIRQKLEEIGERIGPHDLQIAAIALQHDLTLITHNTAEFQRVSGLKLVDWGK